MNEPFTAPQWAYSAVCPDGYDYVAPWCKLHDYQGAAPEWPSGLLQRPILQTTKAAAVNSTPFLSAHDVEILNSRVDMSAISSGLSLFIAMTAMFMMMTRRRLPGDAR